MISRTEKGNVKCQVEITRKRSIKILATIDGIMYACAKLEAQADADASHCCDLAHCDG
jgi:hypothetical protein